MTKKLRCAIYTRKSTEEGLEQSFNSLDAQREACAAYILSQAGEGWTAHRDVYDDGGFSGGNMDRPALRRLLSEIEAGRVDVVVVYKVDRLTRSLADFARMVDVLDRAGASFVSVTQAFNTTTSMGRLTLNVLLSFAQFEREVTGERIRDKIAASKAKGMWMGGTPPLGYDVRDRALHVNPDEADTVRTIFQLYLNVRSTLDLRDELKLRGLRSKVWTSQVGQRHGGHEFSRGALSHLLTNRLYLGEVVHRGKIHPGLHDAIVDRELFEKVQIKLKAGTPALPDIESRGRTATLLGKVFDDRGNAMTSAHANKKGRRYFYYVSTAVNTRKARGSVARVSAPKLEHSLIDLVAPLLDAGWAAGESLPRRVATALHRATVLTGRVTLLLVPKAIDPARAEQHQVERERDYLVFEAPLALARTRRARTLVAETDREGARRIDRALVRAIALARSWADQLAANEAPSLRDIAKRDGLCPTYTRKLLPLAFLAPDLVEALLDGRQPRQLSLRGLIAQPLPTRWADQRALFSRFN